MKDIRIGFIGLGGRGYGLLEWAVLPQKEQVVAVCDVYEDRVQKGAELVEKFGQARPAAYTDYHDVMKDENVNTVIVATAWETHVEIAGREWQGEAFRALLHLPSSCFYVDMDEAEGEVCITVKGSGHGFGMSLCTADYMVREGAELSEIIQTFYQGAACITIP
jgi:peptidoglycan hydrolase-like amidase